MALAFGNATAQEMGKRVGTSEWEMKSGWTMEVTEAAVDVAAPGEGTTVGYGVVDGDAKV